MHMNLFPFNPYTIRDKNYTLSKDSAAVIIKARKHEGIYNLDALKSAIQDVEITMSCENGEVYLSMETYKEIVKIKESTLLLIVSILKGMSNDANLDWKVIKTAEREEFPESKASTELFNDYYMPLTSVLDPDIIYITLELAVVLAIALTECPEKCDAVHQVAQYHVDLGMNSERLQHVVFAIRTLIIDSYTALFIK